MHEKIHKMCAAALLCAIGILIPMISPVKLAIGPMSFTLASHVAIIIAMFISPSVACVVELGTTLGFLLAGFPPVVVVRAATQIIFIIIGAYVLASKPSFAQKPSGIAMLAVALSVVHAFGEMLAVTAFYFAGTPLNGTVTGIIFGLVGVGTFVHSLVDFSVSMFIWIPLSKVITMSVSYLPNFKFHTKVG